MEQPNYNGSILAIATILASIVARFIPGLDITASDIVTIILGIVGVLGVYKQITHYKEAHVTLAAYARKENDM